MVIDFSQHSESEIKFKHCYQPEEIDLNDETARISMPLEIAGVARRGAAIASVKGNLRGRVEQACDRCLQSLETEIDALFDVEYVTLDVYEQAESAPNVEHALSSADFSLSVYDGSRIDIDELAREQTLLNMPSRQLCQEDCAGLCERCGANKNTSSCSCETEQIDPRWKALMELKNKS